MKVGFIGLGEMGGAMVANLIKAGHDVHVWNRSPQPAQRAAQLGATVLASAGDAFACEVVLSMLADDRAAHEVFVEQDALAQASPDCVHVNMATISVAAADDLAKRHHERGVGYVAAPVLGRPDVAAAGKLTIIAAGAAADIERVAPLFDAIGQKTWRLGEHASHANVVKLASNFMLASAIETLSEASALLGGHGVSMQDFLDVVTSSTFPGPVYQGYGKLIAERRYEPAGFKARLGLKDVRLALAAGDAVSVPLPVASVVRDSLIDAIAHGGGDKDFAVLGEVAARRAARV
jgi:3-hydroxyisobutyrate dehydrogenase-like beta-hydroxyacid dehydrogenase